MHSMLTYALSALLVDVARIPTDGWRAIVLGPMEAIAVVTLVPRSVLTLRQLYERDLRGKHYRSDMDTAFGLTSASTVPLSTIVFMGAGMNEGLENDDIPMHEAEVCSGSG